MDFSSPITGIVCCSSFLLGASMKFQKQSGGILIMTVVLLGMFTIMFASLANVTSLQYQQGGLAAQDETAFQIAEAGLNFARWRLSHEPENFSSITQDVTDPLAGVLGSYTLTFVAPDEGSTVVTISSVGHTANAPVRDVTLEATYGIPSLSQFVILSHSDAWYDGEIHGRVHSNGGIRMDGVSDSVMTSAKETYTCQDFHGCHNQTKPGIWGDGSDSSLWQFPVPPVDYEGLTIDLLTMKEASQTAGTYLAPSGAQGYHIVFNANDTYSVYRVDTKTDVVRSYFEETGWEWMSHDIATETLVSTSAVPDEGIIYVEDTLWVQGDIRSRIAIATGRFPDTPSTNTDLIINGNISYGGVTDGTRMLGAVAQGNVLIPYSAAPDVLQMDGAYIAQNGRFGRRYYSSGAYKLRASITRFGMVGSNLTPITAWADSNSPVHSGYEQSTATYDPNLLYAPPPFFPTSGEYQFLSWSRKE